MKRINTFVLALPVSSTQPEERSSWVIKTQFVFLSSCKSMGFGLAVCTVTKLNIYMCICLIYPNKFFLHFLPFFNLSLSVSLYWLFFISSKIQAFTKTSAHLIRLRVYLSLVFITLYVFLLMIFSVYDIYHRRFR